MFCAFVGISLTILGGVLVGGASRPTEGTFARRAPGAPGMQINVPAIYPNATGSAGGVLLWSSRTNATDEQLRALESTFCCLCAMGRARFLLQCYRRQKCSLAQLCIPDSFYPPLHNDAEVSRRYASEDSGMCTRGLLPLSRASQVMLRFNCFFSQSIENHCKGQDLLQITSAVGKCLRVCLVAL